MDIELKLSDDGKESCNAELNFTVLRNGQCTTLMARTGTLHSLKPLERIETGRCNRRCMCTVQASSTQ